MEKVTRDSPSRRYEQDSLVSELEAICDGHVHDELPTVTLARATALSALLMHSRAVSVGEKRNEQAENTRRVLTDMARDMAGVTMSMQDVKRELARVTGSALIPSGIDLHLSAIGCAVELVGRSVQVTWPS